MRASRHWSTNARQPSRRAISPAPTRSARSWPTKASSSRTRRRAPAGPARPDAVMNATTPFPLPVPLEPTAAEAQAAIASEFAFFGDWAERYQYLIDLGRKLPVFPEAWKTETNRLHGCQSMVWIVPDGDASRLEFATISDSAIVSGLVYL